MSKVQKHKAEVDPVTGWYVTEQEAYLPEEWDEAKHTCKTCGEEFILYVSDDTEVVLSGRRGEYCSDECVQESHRRQSREYARRKAAEKRALEKNPQREVTSIR